MSKPIPLTALSARVVAKPPLQMGPNYPDIVSDVEIGGPNDPADRRLVADVEMLEHLLRVARSSVTGRAVLHHVGLRVQTLRDPATGHRWDHVTLIGTEPKPEPAGIFGEVRRG